MFGLEMLIFGPLMGFLAAGAAIAVVTYFVTRYWEHIISWFQEQSATVTIGDVGFTLREEVAAGRCIVVQGVFNTETNTVREARRIKSQNLDEDLQKIHEKNKLAVYH